MGGCEGEGESGREGGESLEDASQSTDSFKCFSLLSFRIFDVDFRFPCSVYDPSIVAYPFLASSAGPRDGGRESNAGKKRNEKTTLPFEPRSLSQAIRQLFET